MRLRLLFILCMSSSLFSCTIDDLMQAINSRNFSHAIQLIRCKVINVNQRWGEEGITPLMGCVTAHRYDVVRILLEHGADPNMGDNQGKVPLFYINYFDGGQDEVELVRLFRSHGADLNVKDTAGRSPLWLLSSGFCDNSPAVMNFTRLFMNYGSDIGMVDRQGKSLLEYAQHSKVRDIINKAFLLVQAAMHNDAEMIRALLKAEPFIVGVKFRGRNCLEIARDLGNYSAARAMEDFFANVIMKATEGVDSLL